MQAACRQLHKMMHARTLKTSCGVPLYTHSRVSRHTLTAKGKEKSVAQL